MRSASINGLIVLSDVFWSVEMTISILDIVQKLWRCFVDVMCCLLLLLCC